MPALNHSAKGPHLRALHLPINRNVTDEEAGCPECGAWQVAFTLVDGDPVLYYECLECHATWERKRPFPKFRSNGSTPL